MAIVRIGVAGLGSVSQRGIVPHLAQDDVKDRIELTAVMDPGLRRLRRDAPGSHRRRRHRLAHLRAP
jgi:hypothetical protein